MTTEQNNEIVKKKDASFWNNIRRRNGNEFKNALEKKTELLTIPDLAQILRHVGYVPEKDIDSLKRFLLSYVDRQKVTLSMPVSVVALLFRAGCVPYLNEELSEKYIELVNKACPMKKKEDFTSLDSPEAQEYINMHRTLIAERYKRNPEMITLDEIFASTQVPDEIADDLAERYTAERKKIVAKKKGIPLEEVSRFDIICALSLEEQDAIKKFYATQTEYPFLTKNETLCTFGTNRRATWNIVNFVKRNFRDIKREDFRWEGKNDAPINEERREIVYRGLDKRPVPEREDAYGTSVTSMQFLIDGGEISIKNRYNHTVVGCDSTYDSDPDKIIPGLTDAIEASDVLSLKKGYLPEGYALIGGRNLFQYETSANDVYFSKTQYLRDGVIKEFKGLRRIDNVYVESATEIFPMDGEYSTLALQKVLLEETRGYKVKFITIDKKAGINALVRVKKDETTGQNIEEEVARMRKGKVISMHLRDTENLSEFLFENQPDLEEFRADRIKSISYRCLGPNLKRVILPKVEMLNEGFLDQCEELEELVIPSVHYISKYALRDLDYRKNKPIRIEAPFLFDERIGLKKGFILEKEAQLVIKNSMLEQLLNEELLDKKITYHFEGELCHIYGDGKKVASIYKSKELESKILYLRLEKVKTAPDDLWSISAKRIDLPNLETMTSTGYFVYSQSHKGVEFLNVPKLKEPGNYFLRTLIPENLSPENYDKATWNAQGIHLYSGFIFLEKSKEIIAYKDEDDYLFKAINSELEKSNDIQIQENNKEVSLIADGIELLRIRDGKIVRACLPTLEEFGNILLNNHPEIEEFEAHRLKVLGYNSLRKCPNLRKVILPKVEEIEKSSLTELPALTELSLPNLVKVGESCCQQLKSLKTLDAPKLRFVEEFSFDELPELENLYLPALENVDSYSFMKMPKVKKLSLPELRVAKNESFSRLDTCQEIEINKIFSINNGVFGKRPDTTKFKMAQLERAGYGFFAGLYFNFARNEVFQNGTVEKYRDLALIIKEEIKDEELSIEEKEGVRFLMAGGKPILREENSVITGVYLHKATSLPSYSFSNIAGLKEIEADKVSEMSYSISNCPDLERVSMKSLKKCASSFRNLPKLKEFQLDTLSLVVDSFCELESINHIKLNSIQSVKGWSFRDLPSVETLSLNGAIEIDDRAVQHMKNLKKFEAKELKEVKYYALFLYSTPSLTTFDAPMLKNKLQLLRHHPNRRTILKNMQMKKDFFAHLKFLDTLAK